MIKYNFRKMIRTLKCKTIKQLNGLVELDTTLTAEKVKEKKIAI